MNLPGLSLREVLRYLDSELRELQDDSDESATRIVSAREYHTGRGSAFAQSRKLLAKFDKAIRSNASPPQAESSTPEGS